MIIELRTTLLVISDITRVGNLAICPAMVTAVWPDESGNVDAAVAPVMVDVIAFPNGRVPVPLQQLRVYLAYSQGGNIAGDFHGYAFLIDDRNTDAQAQAAPVAKPPVRKTA